MEASTAPLRSASSPFAVSFPAFRVNPVLTVGLVLAILVVDWLTPAGVVVGILLSIPIFLASGSDTPRPVWITGGVALAGFVVAAYFGRGPIAPAAVWVPNRVITLLSLPASGALALVLQRRRLDAVRGLEEARAERDLNRLLMSLLAHDLRAPLSVAEQGFKYVQDSLADGRPIDTALLVDVRARMRRSLRAIDVVLSVARANLRDSDGQPPRALAPAQSELQAEIDSFREEAAAQGKPLRVDLAELGDAVATGDSLVLRQAVAILVDNAIRHAVPGPVRVSGTRTAGALEVRVADSGPGLSLHQARGASPSRGSGLGLELCRLLVDRAGGTLEVERDGPEGTTFLLRLPATRP